MLRKSILVLSLLTAACGASIDPAMKSQIDSELAAVQPQPIALAAPTSPAPLPLAVGQWLRLKSVNKSGEPRLITYKVVGMVGAAHWVEVVTDSYRGRHIVKMLINFGNRMDPEQIDIQDIIVKDRNHKAIDYATQGPVLALVRGTYKAVAANMLIQWNGLPQETKTVAGGTFNGAYKGATTVSILGSKHTGTAWYHPAVPINGAVAFVGDDGDSMELLSFGTSGAQSELL